MVVTTTRCSFVSLRADRRCGVILENGVRLSSVSDLIDLVPGSTRGLWIRRWIPELIAAGVLVKRGKRFLGRPSDVVAALLAGDDRGVRE